MDDLTKVLDKELDNNLIKVIISGKRNQSVNADKVKIRPVIIKDNIEFQ